LPGRGVEVEHEEEELVLEAKDEDDEVECDDDEVECVIYVGEDCVGVFSCSILFIFSLFNFTVEV
jgi:hypothetical protein